MNRVQLEPAYLLHQRAYRETSILLEVFSRNRGRIGLVARGARSSKSRIRGLFQPFQPLLLSWSERGELGTLTGAEAGGPAAGLRGDAVFSGWYLNELLLRVLARHDPHAGLYGHYAGTLAGLASAPGPSLLRHFELRLLQELGYAMHLDGDLDPAQWYEYHAESGATPCGEKAGAVRGSSLLDLQRGRLESAQTLRDARQLLRTALAPHLGDRPLQTPRMLRALKAAGKMGSESIIPDRPRAERGSDENRL